MQTDALFRERRRALGERHPSITFILPAAPEAVRNRTVHHPYRQDSDLLYLAGHEEPGACLVLRPGGEATLYVREVDAAHARWTGAAPSIAQCGARSGVDEVRPAQRLAEDLQAHVAAGDAVGFRLGRHPTLDAMVVQALERAAAGARSARLLRPIHDPAGPIGALRAVKSAWEIERLRRSARVTAAAHAALEAGARPGDTGLALAGRFEAMLREAGAARMAYETIVARGEEATVLHARPTRTPIADGELVLVDAGGELDGYASDVTRTWVMGGGDLAGARAALVEGVKAAQAAALAAARPGATLDRVHQQACEVLAETCRAVGLPGDLERWFPHRTSHWIGLDVHDAGPYEDGGAPVALQEGMAFTIEPGLYVDASADDAPAELRGIGVRIEDDVVVTASGAEVLSGGAPTGGR